MARVALGFRTHLGWAAVVALAGPSKSPAVIERRRLDLVDSAVPESFEPYHKAEVLDSSEAEAVVRRGSKAVERVARRAVRGLVDGLRDSGHEVIASGILLGAGRPLPELESVLASHAWIHTAEGELMRRALTRASEACKLPVTGVRERELYERGAAKLRVPADELRQRVTELGRPLGPPWGQDQKGAALVAWLALTRPGSRAR